MVLKNKSFHDSKAPNGDGAAKNKKGVEISRPRKNKEKDKHWDFLDEIEAPMWVDFAQECQSSYQNKDDEWFRISHPFHQCSARELISAFSRDGEGCTNLDLCGQEQLSPKLPSSVSRSRGKDYRSRNWGQKTHIAAFDMQQSVKDLRNKISSANSVTGEVSNEKTRDLRPMDLAGSQSHSIGETSFAEISAQQDQPEPPFRDKKCSTSKCSMGGESNSTCTNMSEGSVGQQQKSLEVSSQAFVQTSQLLSELKICLRKSCVTRQASRMRVTARRQSEVQNSSSSKSSVGTSSGLSSVVENLSGRQKKDKAPGIGYVRGGSTASSGNINVAKSSKAPVARARDINPRPDLRSQSYALPSINQKKAKGKVQSCNNMVQKVLSDMQQQSLQRKALVPHCINKRSPPAVNAKVKEKVVITNEKILAGGRENRAWQVAESQKLKSGEVEQVRKVNRRKLPESCRKTKLVVQKEVSSGRSKGKKSSTMAEKAYFR